MLEKSLKMAAKVFGAGVVAVFLAACASPLPAAPERVELTEPATPFYRIGPLDTLQIFVWRAPEFSTTVPVRPDGRISTPLIEDLQAADKTSTELARDIEEQLRAFVQDPVVTVIVSAFSGPFDQQVRVVGQALQPRAIPYRAEMTVLDVMIDVGGLTDFAAGNRAVLVRRAEGQERSFNVRLNDLLRDGNIDANVPVLPGDIIIIPETWF